MLGPSAPAGEQARAASARRDGPAGDLIRHVVRHGAGATSGAVWESSGGRGVLMEELYLRTGFLFRRLERSDLPVRYVNVL